MSISPPAWTRRFLTPGAFSFAMLFVFDATGRALLTTVLPLEVFRLVGNERDASVLFTVVGCGGILASLFIPAMVRRFRPRWVYTAGALFMLAMPAALATETLVGVTAGMMLRVLGAACLLNVFFLYVMAYIHKRDLARAEPLRTFMSAGSWTIGPTLGVVLYSYVSPYAVYGLASACAAMLLIYFWRMRLEYGPALPADRPVAANPLTYFRRYIVQPRLRLAYVLNFGRETWWATCFTFGPIYLVTAGPGVGLTDDESKIAGSLMVSFASALLLATRWLGSLARRVGMRRFLMMAYVLSAAATLAAVALFGNVWLFAFFMLVGALGGVALDSVTMVTFLRAVRPLERPEMTMVFASYRDLAGLIPVAVYSVLLTVFDLRAVFLAAGALMLACAYWARWIPRGM